MVRGRRHQTRIPVNARICVGKGGAGRITFPKSGLNGGEAGRGGAHELNHHATRRGAITLLREQHSGEAAFGGKGCKPGWRHTWRFRLNGEEAGRGLAGSPARRLAHEPSHVRRQHSREGAPVECLWAPKARGVDESEWKNSRSTEHGGGAVYPLQKQPPLPKNN